MVRNPIPLSTRKFARVFSKPMKPECVASSNTGSVPPMARSRSFFFWISSRAICFAARRKPLHPTRKAKQIADRAIAEARDKAVDPESAHVLLSAVHALAKRSADQERCVALMAQGGKPENIKYAEIHLRRDCALWPVPAPERDSRP
jgi:hypothetical protein